ncbi:MAG: DUF4910 domain-containing protein [Lachnospiraceae bacterium]|nr:DUF4910 domain-containing protein [Candidatus Colinaster equi]
MIDKENIGQDMYNLAGRLFPICRSLSGKGVRQTLDILKEYVEEAGISMQIHNVPTGTQVFDWTVPKEWVINEAYIEDENGNHIIDFKENNLHVMGYSTPVDEWVELDELLEHIETLEEQPDLIPYVTSYYRERYAFCMSENMKRSLKPGKYHMYIDSELIDGNLTYGEILIPGESQKEVFISTYICHPSMANNECSGPALSVNLARYIMSLEKRHYSYRFIYIPETIGSITYISSHLDYMRSHIVAGFNISCVGDDGDYSVVQSRYGDTLADKVILNLLKYRENAKVYSYLERGSDERQYCSPGVDLPFVCFCRTLFDQYPEYHTSADNMDFVSPAGFEGAYDVMTDAINALEHNAYYQVQVLCEPQLGKRGLYPTVSRKDAWDAILVTRDFLSYADGRNDLIDIANIAHVPVTEMIGIAKKFTEHKLVVGEWRD